MKTTTLNHPTHQLHLILRTKDGDSEAATTLNLNMRREDPPTFLILRLPHAVLAPVLPIFQVDDTQSEWIVPLDGDQLETQLQNLSDADPADWMPALRTATADVPAAILVLVNRGRLTVALHGEGNK